jgi:hypothetical protein
VAAPSAVARQLDGGGIGAAAKKWLGIGQKTQFIEGLFIHAAFPDFLCSRPTTCAERTFCAKPRRAIVIDCLWNDDQIAKLPEMIVECTGCVNRQAFHYNAAYTVGETPSFVAKS